MPLSQATVAISGLGLMGGSLALALRGSCRRLVGVARREEVRERALELGIVDDVTGDLGEAAAQADVVVLATPVRHVLQSIPEAAAAMRPGALLIDLGSTKRQVVEAMNSIPENVLAIGGHPMCGKESGGLERADAQLFRGAVFVLTPSERTTQEALGLAQELAATVGACPLVLDAERHDWVVAVISHLPYLLASSLVRTEQEAREHDDIVHALAASGFRDTTRVAGSPVDMMLDILLTNTSAVEQALDMFEEQLAGVRRLLRCPEALEPWIAQSSQYRREMFS